MKPLYFLVLIVAAVFYGAGTAYSSVHAVPKEPLDTKGSDVHLQPPISYATLWAGEDGTTHIGHCRLMGLELKSYAPPAAPQWIGLSPDNIDSIAYAVLPPGYVGNWHRAPGPQWVITLQGKWSVETTDGSVLVQGPGEMQFNADTQSRPRPGDVRVGHITRTVGDEPNVQVIIKLKSRAFSRSIKGNCDY